eukprot:UN14849
MLLVVESGLSIDVQHIKDVGFRAFFLALIGVLFPVMLVFITWYWGLDASWKESLAIGASLAPTSLGFSAQLLKEHGQMETSLGTLICTAADR